MRHHRLERGFALPITIFLITLLTVMLAAAFSRVAVDRSISSSSDATVNALAIAQSGLQNFLGDTFTVPPAENVAIRYNFTNAGGYADVTPALLRNPANTRVIKTYIVRSVGYVIDPSVGSTPQAQRTVAQFAEWQPGSLDTLMGAWTAVAGLDNDGTTTISGDDQCVVNAPSITGIRVSDDGTNLGPPNVTGNPAVVTGDPSSTVGTLTHIDWASVIADSLSYDYRSFQNGNMTYPSQFIQGDLRINVNSTGSGLLVVTRDLETRPTSFTFNGVILVGRKADLDAVTDSINGVIITGLNELLPGQSAPESDIDRTSYVLYCSTSVNLAMKHLTGWVPILNAWVDNWAEY